MKPIGLAILSLLLLSATALKAETIDVVDSHGGSVAAYDAKWSRLGQQGVSVRIVGPCQSACTVLLGHIPRSRICVTPQASFRFHLAKHEEGTRIMLRSYQSDIKSWINQHGGLTPDFLDLQSPDIYRFFKRCKA